MDDLISRQAAIDAIEFGITYAKAISKEMGEVKELFQEGNNELRKAVERVKALPPEQPDRKHGKRIYHIDDIFPAESTMECDQCHAEQPLTCDDEFCPHCGARMEGDK